MSRSLETDRTESKNDDTDTDTDRRDRSRLAVKPFNPHTTASSGRGKSY